MFFKLSSFKVSALFIAMLLVTACEGMKPTQQEIGPPKDKLDRQAEAMGKLGGGDGILNELFRGRSTGGGTGIGVNAYLWQASLDTVSFMPLASADSFGGIIITDWYSPDDDHDSRYKLNIYIIGRELRTDGLRVASFKQKLVNGIWIDVPENVSVNNQLEDSILTRARQMRIDARAIAE